VNNSLDEVFDARDIDKRNRPKQYLFSPLFLLRQMLNSPSYAGSDAYAHVVVRAEVFAASVAFAKKIRRPANNSIGAAAAVKTFIAFASVAASLQKMNSDYRNDDTFYPSSPTDFIVAHMLAARGLAVLTFAPGDGSYRRDHRNEKPLIGRDTFLRGESLMPANGMYEFRVLDDVGRLPSAAELINELDGVPLPIPGADAVFARGIRTTASRGVVGRISGQSGAGKTSVALSIAAALAPLGATTLYLSCEEEPVDLQHRIATLTPPFVSRTHTFPSDISDWFHAVYLSLPEPAANRKAASDFINDMIEIYRTSGISPSEDAPPGAVPLLVVFDGVHEIIQHNTDVDQVVVIRNLIERFRDLGAFVLILTAETDDPALRELDYSVDFVIRLTHAPPNDASEEPLRYFILHKTRLQYSRHGSHILHISKRDGVRIYPQLTSQLDTFAHLRWKPLNQARWFDFLQTGLYAEQKTRPLVRIFERSQVLISGRGSTGKASFALKLLMKQLIPRQTQGRTLFAEQTDSGNKPFKDPRRLLVISFLYDGQYYLNLAKSLAETLILDSSSREAPPSIAIDVLSLYPGYLAPEVLVQKIVERIERRSLDGSPYSGVLIDGLHNVFLQFPRLQSVPMIWPILFQILRVVGTTVVTTHTHFELRGMGLGGHFRADLETAIQRVGPLLQTLVHSADFYLDISLPMDRTDGPALYTIDVVAAISQDPQSAGYLWNRENRVVEVRRNKLDTSASPSAPH
jgi:KaiC/GvpD/RAD55 family RecA-like ATPase